MFRQTLFVARTISKIELRARTELTYSTLIRGVVVRFIAKWRIQKRPRARFSFSLSRSLHGSRPFPLSLSLFLSPTTFTKLGMAEDTTIYSIFAKLAESLPGKPTDQPDVLSFLASLAKERWWKSLTERGMGIKRMREASFLRRLTFLSYLWREITEKMRFCPPGWLFISLLDALAFKPLCCSHITSHITY